MKHSKEDVENFVEFCGTRLGKEIIKKEAEYIGKKFKGRKFILDVGCGIASLEARLSDLNIVGLDSSPEMLKEARKRTDKPLILSSAEKLPFWDSSFDAILFLTTLEFLPNFKKAIAEAYRVLKPKGLVLAMVLNPESKYFLDHLKKPTSYFHRAKHRNMEKLTKAFSAFKKIRTEYFLGINKKVYSSKDPKKAALFCILAEK